MLKYVYINPILVRGGGVVLVAGTRSYKDRVKINLIVLRNLIAKKLKYFERKRGFEVIH